MKKPVFSHHTIHSDHQYSGNHKRFWQYSRFHQDQKRLSIPHGAKSSLLVVKITNQIGMQLNPGVRKNHKEWYNDKIIVKTRGYRDKNRVCHPVHLSCLP